MSKYDDDRIRSGEEWLDAQEDEAKEQNPWPHSTGDVSGFLRTPAPGHQWFARDRLLMGRAGLLTAVGGSSKTRTLIHLAVGAVTGILPWNWQIDRTGSAALFLTEDTGDQVHRALHLIARTLAPEQLALLSSRLRVYALAGKQSTLLALRPSVGLVPTERVVRLIEICQEMPELVFVGLDPALALSDGDESNPAHQRRLGELVDKIAIETGACVLLASHAAKALQGAEEIGSHSSRGSGAITDAVRSEYVLRTMNASEAKRYGVEDIAERKAHVQLLPTKGNELPPDAYRPVWLRRGEGGVLEQVTLTEVDKPAAGPSSRDLDALDVLRELTAKGSAKVSAWGRACADRGILSGSASAIEKAIHRCKASLLSAGLIVPGVTRGVFVPADGEVDL